MAMQGAQFGSVFGNPISSYGIGDYAGQALNPAGERDYMLARLAELRRMTKAQRREKAEGSFDTLVAAHVESLRSVSAVARERMRQEAWIERSHQREIAYLLRTIAGMK